MSGYCFDTNILIDALLGHAAAHDELRSLFDRGERLCISRMSWIEVMSKGEPDVLSETEAFLSGFRIDEIDAAIAARAASLRRQRPRMKSPDAIILATAQANGAVLVTRNTKDFPASMPGVRVPYMF